jgi:polysaccharide deacetylase family protein (PEP-CTERM system associated)
VLTVDVEDWYHLTGEQIRGAGTLRPEVLARQIDRLLGLLDRHDCRATFFCLGGSLSQSPELVRRIAEAGHEVGTHGWGHQLISRVGLDAFREDLRRSIGWLEDLLGRAVHGHRAPAFSVTRAQLEGFYDICFEAGLQYDSSVFPIAGRRYGIPDVRPEPHTVRSQGDRRLVELPLSTVRWLGRTWPVAGGGHWRILPVGAIHASIRTLTRLGRPMVTYLHPYEFDTQRLSAFEAAGVSGRSLKHDLKQNLRRGSMYRKLDTILAAHRFGAAEDYIRDVGRI